MTTTTPHFLNRHIVIADNLDLLKNLDNETIDLVCCDPPFAKNQTFTGEIKPRLEDFEIAGEKALLEEWGIDSKAAAEKAGLMWPYDDTSSNEAKFADIWRYEKVVHEDWVRQLEEEWKPVSMVIDAALEANGENMAAYLTYMAVRMIEIHRVLKPTGSFFIHCDSEANSYLRLLLDGIFGKKNFRNEIAWCYKASNSPIKNRFRAKHDSILFYSKSEDTTFNEQFTPYDEDYVKTHYKHKDEAGRLYRKHSKRADGTERRIYLDEAKGAPVLSWWADITSFGTATQAKERTGYPTQKPVALAERIIKAATNEGDVVLDPFAGCAYVPVAAERLHRQWIACDISIRSHTVLKRQFQKFDYSVDGETDEAKLGLSLADISTLSPSELPERTDEDPLPVPALAPLPARKYKTPASDISDQEMKEMLLELSGWQAWCCGFANRMPDGTPVETTANFHLDHIDPKSKDGSNRIVNRAPLCQQHNQMKKDRHITLEQLRDEIEAQNGFLVDSRDDLINLSQAKDQVLDLYFEYRLARGIEQKLPQSEAT